MIGDRMETKKQEQGQKEGLKAARRDGTEEKKVLAVATETTHELYFRKINGALMAHPVVIIKGENDHNPHEPAKKITINFYGGYGAREEYGAEITFRPDGQILTAEALPKGMQGYDGDSYRVPSKIILLDDGVSLELAETSGGKDRLGNDGQIDKEAPKIVISKKGVQVGDTFVPMEEILP